MFEFFAAPPQTPGEAFLRGFKYINKDGQRNSWPGYNLIKHNEELSAYILEQASEVVRLCSNLANNYETISMFLDQLNNIIDNVRAKRIECGKAVLKNVHRNRLEFEEEAEITPIKTADIYRIPYKPKKFENDIVNGLNRLKRYINEDLDANNFLIEKCNLCISTINNYHLEPECVALEHPFYRNTDVKTEAATIAKQSPVSTLPMLGPK